MAAVLLTSFVFSLGGFINAIFAKNFDQISWFPTFVLTPLTYFGGVFYSISLLPRLGGRAVAREPDPLHGECVSLSDSSASRTSMYGWRLPSWSAFAVLLFSLAVTLMNRGVGIRE